MHSHPMARLTQRGQLRLLNLHLENGRSLAELATENGVSLRSAFRQHARYRSGGPTALADRRRMRRHRWHHLSWQLTARAVQQRSPLHPLPADAALLLTLPLIGPQLSVAGNPFGRAACGAVESSERCRWRLAW
jgi:hypothetical protein